MTPTTPLHVRIYSFSYKKSGIPADPTPNGGGFVFDCRGVLNPGRLEPYKALTGADQEVACYLEESTRMPQFLQGIKDIVTITVEDYIQRGFESLQISFGCTGGQHRSVYGAIQLAKYLQERYPAITVSIQHQEQPQLNHSSCS